MLKKVLEKKVVTRLTVFFIINFMKAKGHMMILLLLILTHLKLTVKIMSLFYV